MDHGKLPLNRRTRAQTALYFKQLWEERRRAECGGGHESPRNGRMKRSDCGVASAGTVGSETGGVSGGEKDCEVVFVAECVGGRGSGSVSVSSGKSKIRNLKKGSKRIRNGAKINYFSRKIQNNKGVGRKKKKRAACSVRGGLARKTESEKRPEKDGHSIEIDATDDDDGSDSEVQFLDEVVVPMETRSVSASRSNVDQEKDDNHATMEDEDVIFLGEKGNGANTNFVSPWSEILTEMVELEIFAGEEEPEDSEDLDSFNTEDNNDSGDLDFRVDYLSSPDSSPCPSEEEIDENHKARR